MAVPARLFAGLVAVAVVWAAPSPAQACSVTHTFKNERSVKVGVAMLSSRANDGVVAGWWVKRWEGVKVLEPGESWTLPVSTDTACSATRDWRLTTKVDGGRANVTKSMTASQSITWSL